MCQRKVRADDVANLQAEGYSNTVARIIAARIPAARRADVEARLSRLTPPQQLPDMDKAVKRLQQALISRQVIGIVSDHDVDGVSSHALLKECLTGFAADEVRIQSWIGHRLKDGYGLSAAVAQRILASEPPPAVVITADCGSSDEPRIQQLQAAGIDVIVTDHHEIPQAGIPASAFACISPARNNSNYKDSLIAGCMVAWLLMAALRSTLAKDQQLPATAADIRHSLDFVALGTVADCVSLARSHNNRAVVRAGLRLIESGTRPCWRSARRYLGEAPHLSALDLAFGIGPRINARGRLDEAMSGVHFLLADSDAEADDLADLLEKENLRRRDIERQLTDDAVDQATQRVAQGHSGLAIWLKNGHTGVHGIVASRLVERFGRPAVCLSPHAFDEETVSASARSIDGLHIQQLLQDIQTAQPSLMSRFGGHAGAAGLSLPRRNLQTFIDRFEAFCSRQLEAAQLGPKLNYDLALAADEISDELLQQLAALEPWGRAFEQAVFISDFKLINSRAVGADQSHLSLYLQAGQQRFSAIWFSALKTGYNVVDNGKPITLAYTPQHEWYKGVRRTKLRIHGQVSN